MNKERKIIVAFLGCLALFFYAVSWSVKQYGETAWYIGIGLPWLSLLAGILIMFVSDSVFKKYLSSKTSWGHLYAFCTIVYVIVMTVIAKTIFPFIPHLAACACFIASIFIDLISKDADNTAKKIHDAVVSLENKLESIDKLVIQTEEENNDKTKKKLLDLIFIQTAESFRMLDDLSGHDNK